MVSVGNVIEVMGVAERFNAYELEDQCVKFMCLNGVYGWSRLSRRVIAKIRKYQRDNFVQLAINGVKKRI